MLQLNAALRLSSFFRSTITTTTNTKTSFGGLVSLPSCRRFTSHRFASSSSSSSSSESGQTTVTTGEATCRRSTPLHDHLVRRIKTKGPITLHEYMTEALTNPMMGYYTTRTDILGKKGDFITSPEVSQMFGESVAVWLINEWMLLKKLYGADLPNTNQLIELGAGKGTLMNDVLRTMSRSQQLRNVTTRVFMVDASAVMRKRQFETLCVAVDGDRGADGHVAEEPQLLKSYPCKYSATIQITWLQHLSELPRYEAPHFFFANEFFDALPAQKFVKTDKGYRELLVDYNEQLGQLQMVVSRKKTLGTEIILKMHPAYAEHEHVEVSAASGQVMESLARTLHDYNGSALIIDYGHDGQCKDTLRAFKAHQLVDPMQAPGECDLTVDVDFRFLRHVAEKNKVVSYGPAMQTNFLKQMHIDRRFQALLANCSDQADRAKLTQDYSLLMDSDKMGERFKLLALRKFDLKQAPPGFNELKTVVS